MIGAKGQEGLKLARTLWKMAVEGKGYESALKKVVITSAGDGSCEAEFKVEEGMTNRGGILHGGCTATLIDCISTIGLMTNGSNPGVSVNLSINYLKGAEVGETISISSKTVRSGKKLAFLETVLTTKEKGRTIATGTHVKFIGS